MSENEGPVLAMRIRRMIDELIYNIYLNGYCYDMYLLFN